MQKIWIHRYTLFVACTILLLIFAGGLVTSTGSGLSVPDWPLSYGQFFPPMIGGIRFEHSHRLIAATVGLLTFVLTALFLKYEKRGWAKGLAVGASAAVLAQAILGGLTVKFLLPRPVSVAHACLGQSFFCLVASMALVTSREWFEAVKKPSIYAGSFQRLTLTTTVFIFLQLVAGAFVRHSEGRGVPMHLFLAFFIVIHIVFLDIKAIKDKTLSGLFGPQLIWLNASIALQLFLGLGTFIFKLVLEKAPTPRFWEVLLATGHQTMGALILCNSLLMGLRAWRLLNREKGGGDPSDYMVLMKPKVTLAALATVLVGYLLAAGVRPFSISLTHVLLGSFFIGGGGHALNQFFEHDVDGKMKRTEDRPLPGGRLGRPDVLWFGVLAALTGIAELLIFVGVWAALLGILTFLSYVFCYTPLKRCTGFNTFVGAVPGALPILIGWVAAKGKWGPEALSLFLILFLWQIPHFFAIAWVHREDYRRSGLKMLPAEDMDGRTTAQRIVLYSALLVPVTLLPVWAGLSGTLYLICALVTGSIFLTMAISLSFLQLQGAKRFVSASIYYLFFLMFFLVVDKY